LSCFCSQFARETIRGMRRVCVLLLPVALFLGLTSAATVGSNSSVVVSLYPNGTDELNETFKTVYGHFANTFDMKLYDGFVGLLAKGMAQYKTSQAYNSYKNAPTVPHCDKGVAVVAQQTDVHGMAPFPGGVVGQVFAFDFGKHLFDLSEKAEGPASAGLIAPMALTSQALSAGMGLIQSTIASSMHVVPPLVPPPMWNNQPLTCAPMVSGHNCFGSVLYPITMADFMIADVTDAMLDGYIAGFPSAYSKKVGKTNDSMYQACFASYMSMMCSSMFPRCTTPQSRDEPVPVGGRVPMCLHMCILPLVMCPGFWMDDLMGSCSMVSVPPMCTQASFGNLWRLPPQYTDFSDANPFPRDCPQIDTEFGMDAEDDPNLYEDAPRTLSPIERAAASAANVPAARLFKFGA